MKKLKIKVLLSTYLSATSGGLVDSPEPLSTREGKTKYPTQVKWEGYFTLNLLNLD